jgi:S1-C subfamily serine protease
MNKMRNVLDRYRGRLHRLPNVHAVGIGYKIKNGVRTDTPAFIVSVDKKLPKALLAEDDIVPREIENTPTDVVERKPFNFLATTDRTRPAPGGVSIGIYSITAGTLSCVVKRDGERYILSNNHVLAFLNQGQIDDPILQPGAYDGGTIENDTIARLYDYVPIMFSNNPCPVSLGIVKALNTVARLFGRQSRFAVLSGEAENKVDCAIARPIRDSDVSDEILEIGLPQGLKEPRLWMGLQKMGRTTGYTEGKIIEMDVSLKVGMQPDYALFVDQIMTDVPSDGGDSGSAVLDEDKNLVGLLFAGNGEATVCNKMVNVFDALDLSL